MARIEGKKLQGSQLHTAASRSSEQPPKRSTSTAGGSSQLWETLHDSIRSLTQTVSAPTVLHSVKSLLEAGDVVRAFNTL